MLRLERDSMMACMVCGNTLRKCTCPDVDERLKAIGASPNIVTRMCMVCGNHYARCNCEHPIWRRSDQDFPDPKFNRLQQLDDQEATNA